MAVPFLEAPFWGLGFVVVRPTSLLWLLLMEVSASTKRSSSSSSFVCLVVGRVVWRCLAPLYLALGAGCV